jgi:hypothetical protein
MAKKEISHEEAVKEAMGVFGVSKGRILELIESLYLTIEFINLGTNEKEKKQRRGIIEERFVYFWEFRNKAMRGRSKYTNNDELQAVKDMFFSLMLKGIHSPLKNVKQVEPLIQAKRDKTAWAILEESDGSKLSIAVNIINDKKEIRKAEDKIRLFHAWLEEQELDKLSNVANGYLFKLKTFLDEKSKDAKE